jgi:hypothetical protein
VCFQLATAMVFRIVVSSIKIYTFVPDTAVIVWIVPATEMAPIVKDVRRTSSNVKMDIVSPATVMRSVSAVKMFVITLSRIKCRKSRQPT